MNRLLAMLFTSAFLLAASGGCEPPETDVAKGAGEPTSLSLSNAAAFAALTASDDGLCTTGAAPLSFSLPGAAFGFRLAGAEGAALRAWTTGDVDFDTVLLLYGPDDGSGYYGSAPVAMDDDGGEGRLSRLDGYTFKADGSYLLVATTWQGGFVGEAALHVETDGAAGCTAAPPLPGQALDGPCDDGIPCTETAMTDRGCALLAIDQACARAQLDCCVVASAEGGGTQYEWHEADCAPVGGVVEGDRERCGEPPSMMASVCCEFENGGPTERQIVGDMQCEMMDGLALIERECWLPSVRVNEDDICCALLDGFDEPATGWRSAASCAEDGGEAVEDASCEVEEDGASAE